MSSFIHHKICYGILNIMKMYFLLLSISFAFAFIAPKHAVAIAEFTTTFNSLYSISSSGETKVTHTITLKNNLSHIYATDYSIATSGDKLANITANDESGPLQSTINFQNGITNILLTINHPTVGKDQTKTITLSYQTDDVVEIIGNTTTINIPRLARANEAESYTRVVRVQNIQDRPALIYPSFSKSEPDGDYTIYTFDGHQSDSLTLLFGNSVTYKLDLTYELRSKELNASDSELALPPDTDYQHIMIDSITPPPINIHLDESGNWLARYNLRPQEKLLVKAVLYATIYPQPTLFDPSSITLDKSPGSKYWETKSATVANLADQLKTPENIYRYITSNFTYNYAGATAGSSRKGAQVALSSPTNVLCTEFTDSFVSLARALQIPSREINGYGYTKNSTLQPQNTTTDILHSWPEFYDTTKKQWISIDPTWGNTTGGIDYFNKLDFSHIAFVRHGVEDSYPLPAGSYKSIPSEKYIQVEVAKEVPYENSSYELKKEANKAIIRNNGNVALLNKSIDIGGKTIIVNYLAPYDTYLVQDNQVASLYDKIKRLCAKLLSKFSQQLQASM